MRKLILIFLFIPFCVQGQDAEIYFNIKNSSANNIEIIRGNYTDADRLFEKDENTFVPLIAGKGNWTIKLSNPIFITMNYHDTITNNYYSYIFYFSPGDKLNFSFDSKSPEKSYIVKGIGNENNQPLIQKVFNNPLNLDAYKKDSLPDNVLNNIFKRSSLNQKILSKYISKNHPSEDFIKYCSLYTQYFPLWTYIDFKGEQMFNESCLRNDKKWQVIEDSLTNALPVNNIDMLIFDEYDYFLEVYLIRIKERLWNHIELLKEYYGTSTNEEAFKLFNEDPENLLQEKIIEKNFRGKTAEFLYGVLFHKAIGEDEDNVLKIFSRFKQKYPQSQYISYIEPGISKIEERITHKFSDKFIFVENNDSYQTFQDILRLVKGKTVLLDMWGTWCGPCRSEIAANSDSIKSYFKDKALDYLYIANYDTNNEPKWKKLISYYNLTGTNILANQNLTKDIMDHVKGNGFPTYIIIKKDGTFELSAAGYPMKRDVLIKQLNKALN